MSNKERKAHQMMFVGRHVCVMSDEPPKTRGSSRIVVRIACFLIVILPVRLASCELVHFEFAGMFTGGSSGKYTLFGIEVPRNAIVRGRFSYDTESQSAAIDAGTRTFHQEVPSGLALDIHNGAIRLSTNDFAVTIANDFGVTPMALDLFSVDYDSRWSPPPSPLIVNDVPWSGPTAFIKVALSWPSPTFDDPDEPKLTTTRPLAPDAGVTAFVGSSTTPRMFSIEAIAAVAPEPHAISFVWSGLLCLAAGKGRRSRYRSPSCRM